MQCRTPLLAGIAQNAANLILDISLVSYFSWGVRGAATAITIAQVSDTMPKFTICCQTSFASSGAVSVIIQHNMSSRCQATCMLERADCGVKPPCVQYIGVMGMLGMLSRKSMLQLSDMSKLPSTTHVLDMLKTGVPLAFCIASVMTTVVSATNLAAGADHPQSLTADLMSYDQVAYIGPKTHHMTSNA